MANPPKVLEALDAIVAKVEAIVPTIDPAARFRRSSEKTPPTTKAGKRLFDVDFQGHPRDLSNEGQGVQNPGIADRIATFTISIDYPLARNEKALEATTAVDSELVLRALGRSANWNGTPVQIVRATSAMRTDQAEDGMGAGFRVLVVTADVQYRDRE